MDKNRPHRKILRSPTVKRKSKALPVNQRVQLQRVLGITVSSNAGISCDSNFGTIAYPAGCVVVLFNPRRNKQSYIFNTTKKPVTCLSFSRDGKYLITGETGHQPAVRVWDVQEKLQVAEFHGHKFGISCVAFSPNMKEIVSVGTQHDMMINVWNWKTGIKMASNKISSKVSALTFSEDGKCFVTVGNRHVRYWYLDDKRSKINQTVPLMGRSGILGDHKDNHFCDVVAGQGHMCGTFFVITQSGLLCEFNEKRQLDKWVELRTKSANCITAGLEHIFVGCSEGTVWVFNATSLHYLCSLPKPHHLGVEVTTATNPSHMVSNREDARYPHTKAITIDDDHKKVTCIYNDQSVYIWDVHDIKRIGKAWSFLYHSGCIWALEVYPPLEDESKAMMPPGSFLTASGDNTIRVWNLNTHMPENTAYRRNIYSNELLKIVYVDPTLNSLCNVDYNPAGATDKTDTSYDGKSGVRSLSVSPDGADLASGDRQGNVRIYNMQYLNEKKCIEAHDSDVMCLEYSYTNSGHFLATSSRDRLIHVFDVDENYGLVQTLGDHSSSITAVRFTDLDNKLMMISCGADKSILLRNAVTSPEFQFQLEHHLATKITLYDMVIDPTQKLLATACQDRNVRLYNIQTTKEKKCYKGSAGDEGVLLRIHLDPSGTYVATTCTDKNVCILDFQTGEIVATMYGHSEVITGVKFVNDLKHVITVSADGCIYVWRLPADMTNQMKGRLLELGKTTMDTDYFRSDQSLMPNPVMLDSSSVDGSFPVVKSASTGHISFFDDDNIDGKMDGDVDPEDMTFDAFDDGASHASLDFKISIGQLPSWAKAKFGDAHSEGSESSQEHIQPKGRWAQRVDHTVEFKSQLDLTSDEDTLNDRRQSSEASSSKLSDLRRETVVLRKQSGNKNLHHVDDDLTGSTENLHMFHSTHMPFQSLNAARKSEGFGHFKSDTSLNTSTAPGKGWSDRFDFLKSRSLELDDTDDLDTGSDTTEIIYPPSTSDSDVFASSYKVFGVDDVKQDKSQTSQGNVSSQDDNSVSTDPISLEDEEDPNDETLATSGPTTPSDPDKEFLSRTPDKEDFVRENFEEDSFTPIPLEKFTRSLDTLEKQIAGSSTESTFESTPFSSRLSLSARFMSRALTSTVKNTTSSQITFRQDNWYNKNKMEMSRAMDETRKSLLAMNLRRSSSESESPDKDNPPSPPTKLEEGISFSAVQINQTSSSCTMSPPPVFVSPPWSYCSKNLRRLWATFTLSKESITEEMTFAQASRSPSNRNCCLISDKQSRKPNLQPQLPNQLIRSQIPTPMSSPRPPRCRRGGRNTDTGSITMSPTTGDKPGSITMSLTTGDKPGSITMRPTTGDKPGSITMSPTTGDKPGSITMSPTTGDKPVFTSDINGSKHNTSTGRSSLKDPPQSVPTNGGKGNRVLRDRQNISKGRTSSPRSVSSHRKGGLESENGIRNSPKDLLKTSSQAHNHSPTKTNPPIIASSIAQKISEERERRRISAKTEQADPVRSVETSSPKYGTKTRPTYFKPTLSSKNRTSRNSEGSSETSVVTDKSQDLTSKRVKAGGRLLGSKLALYASTPNLLSGLDDDNEPEEKPQAVDKFSSTSNLRQLSDLSQSVPDVKDADSSTGISSRGPASNKQPHKSVIGQNRKTTRFSLAVIDKQLMPPPQFIPASSSITFTQNRRDPRVPQIPVTRRKSSSSELTLDQAKSILLGKSGVLSASNKTDIAAISASTSKSGRNSRSLSSSNQSSLSTLTSTDSPPVFDSELARTNPTQLAVAEEIEHTANMLRHQKQANIINTLSSERLHSQSSNLEASPMDLPERDQPSRHHSSPKQPPRLSLSPQQRSLGVPTSQPFQHTLSPQTSADPALLIEVEENSDSVFDECREEDSKSPASVRDRIALYQSHNPIKGASTQNSSPYRRILPTSPNMAAVPAENNQSDTGVGSSESSDTDNQGQAITYVRRTSINSLTSVDTGKQQQIDRSRLAFPITPSPPPPPVSINQCESLLNDFKSNLHLLKDLFTQVDGRTDENAQQVLAMLGEVFHDAKVVITDLASRVPSPPQKSTDILSVNLSSTSMPQGSQNDTFHTAVLKPPLAGAPDKTSGSSKTEEPTPGNKGAILTATKDLLQPLVSQLSQDLSEGIWKLIRERVDETF